MAKKAGKETPAVTYTKEQIVNSQKYRPYRDVLGSVLTGDKAYTAAEIEKVKDDFLNRPVKEKINGRE